MTAAKTTKISQSDLKIYPSERLTDFDDGGGMPTGIPLTGQANELFDPIPSIARLNGGFYARSVFAGVLRPDDEPLIGAFTALTRPPKDAAVSYLLFGASRFGESRAEVINRIEAYNVATIESKMTLLSTQSANSRVLQAYQRTDEPLPLIGDVYCLRQDKRGYEYAEQYIQVTRIVKAERRTFYNKATNKEFTRMVVQLEISTPLKTDFVGAEYPDEGYLDVPCKIRETGVADAAQYYGIKPIAQPIGRDVMQIRIPTIMEKLVPTNQINTPLLDLTAAGQRQTLFDGAKAGADGEVTLAINKPHDTGSISQLYFGNAITPNSVSISTTVGAVTDKGGSLYLADKAVGSVDYAKGFALINEPSFYGTLTSLRFRPAGSELKVVDTARTDVDINNRSSSYTINFDPAPAVGTLQASYRVQGEWYTLSDDGSGVLKGASAQHGSGNINFATGSAVINLTELPDVNSAILWSWGTQATYFNRSGTLPIKLVLPLPNRPATSSIKLTWRDADGAEQTAMSDAKGNITGMMTGRYDAAKQRLEISGVSGNINGRPVITVASLGAISRPIRDYAVDGDEPRVTIDTTDFVKGSLSFEWVTQAPLSLWGVRQFIRYHDDGQGNVIDGEGNIKGSMDYDGHTATFEVTASTYAYEQHFSLLNGRWRLTSLRRQMMPVPIDRTRPITVTGAYADTVVSKTEVIPSKLQIDLLPDHDEVVVPSSLHLHINGNAYFDVAGNVCTRLDPTTGASTVVGVIDYQTAVMTLDNWEWSMLGDANIKSLVSSVTANPVDAVTFRTPQSPIRPGSLVVRATAVDGTRLRVVSDYAGRLSGDGADGEVDYEFGVASIRFGSWVNNDADAQSKDWYHRDNVKNGRVWQPKHVLAETITYNADAYTYLPINSSVVKIDTVRLPQDGRVPIFRRGDTMLITNTQSQDIGSAHTGGQTVQLERDDVDRICVTDSNGKPVNAELWSHDLAAGSITWVKSLDLSEYQMPLMVKHTQEERNVILEADIDGTLSLRFATKRAYPIKNTYVSSVLIGDTLRVRASVPFTQRNWDSVWRDTPNGAQLLNKLNLKDYPMVLTDDGAITDRWLIRFASSSQFELYSEALGYVGKFDTLTDLAPINPATNKPYFTIPKQAFGTSLAGGAPWGSQDVIRFDTWGTLMPVWVLCAVQPTANTLQEEDGFSMCVFGDTTEN